MSTAKRKQLFIIVTEFIVAGLDRQPITAKKAEKVDGG